MKQSNGTFTQGMLKGWPIALGYFSISITFGIVATANGLTSWESTLMSIWVFAGASQFIAIELIAKATAFEIIFTTFVLNLRHLLMSTSLSKRIKSSKSKSALFSFGITDETFAVASMDNEQHNMPGRYFAGIAFIAYCSWILGTMVGSLFGEFIPQSLTNSMGIALYAMFIALLTPAIKYSFLKTFIAASSGGLCTLLYYTVPQLSNGWSIIISTIFASVLGVLIQSNQQHVEGSNAA